MILDDALQPNGLHALTLNATDGFILAVENTWNVSVTFTHVLV